MKALKDLLNKITTGLAAAQSETLIGIKQSFIGRKKILKKAAYAVSK